MSTVGKLVLRLIDIVLGMLCLSVSLVYCGAILIEIGSILRCCNLANKIFASTPANIFKVVPTRAFSIKADWHVPENDVSNT